MIKKKEEIFLEFLKNHGQDLKNMALMVCM